MTHVIAAPPSAVSEHTALQPGSALHVLLADGSSAEIRHSGPGDFGAVRSMHAEMSPDNLYLRFFSLSPGNAEREAQRVCREPAPDHAALLGWLGGELAGVASYEPTAKPGVAEIAHPDQVEALFGDIRRWRH